MTRFAATWIGLTLLIVTAAGCAQGFHDARQVELTAPSGPYQQPFATAIEYPDVEAILQEQIAQAPAPRTLENPAELPSREIGLEEAIRMALMTNEVVRSLGGAVVQAPGATTIYDIALTESDPGGSVEAALSAFDAQLSTNLFFNRSERPVNQTFPNLFRPTFVQNASTFVAEVNKTTATGSRFALRHHINYSNNNNLSQSFPSSYNLDYEAEWRQPLLQGAGLRFNRIAGPNGQPGGSSGVLLARLNTDVALADFESSVITLAADVERAYWELYFAYHNLEATLAARRSALNTWRNAAERARLGLRGGEPENEAQARAQYYTLEAAVQQALSGPAGLYLREEQLRMLVGLPPNDGELLKPKSDPMLAEVLFDWTEVLNESLYRRVELRRQKWTIKRRQLELEAAQNHLLPRLDAVGLYRWYGFGDGLIRPSGPTGFESAYQNLTTGDFQEWQMGLEFSLPIGFRRAAAAVRNAELRLARENAVLQEQQLRVSHELSAAIREVRRTHQLIRTNFNRRVASQYEVEAIEAMYEAGRLGINVLIQSQQRLADSTSAYFRAVADYNLAIASLHQRKGSLLQYDRIHLAEGPWTAADHEDAHRRSRGFVNRQHAISTPIPLSAGEYDQQSPLPPLHSSQPMQTAPQTPSPATSGNQSR